MVPFMRACFLTLISTVLWNLPASAQETKAVSGPRLVASLSDEWKPPGLSRSTWLSQSSASLSRGAKWALGGGLVVGILSAATANALCERQDGCTGPTLT